LRFALSLLKKFRRSLRVAYGIFSEDRKAQKISEQTVSRNFIAVVTTATIF